MYNRIGHYAPQHKVPEFTPPKPRPTKNGIYDSESTKPTIFATPLGGTKYVVNITDDIDSPSTYDEVIALLSSATEQDEIVFNINSYGGFVDSLNMILGWKQMCPAKQTHVLMGNASSAATGFFLSPADNYIVGDRATFMCHEYQVSSGGTSSNSKLRTDHSHRENINWVESTYSGFLSKNEIADILRGVEVYLNAEEIRNRLTLREKLKAEEAERLHIESQNDLSEFTSEQLEGEVIACREDIKLYQKELKSRNATSKGLHKGNKQ